MSKQRDQLFRRLAYIRELEDRIEMLDAITVAPAALATKVAELRARLVQLRNDQLRKAHENMPPAPAP